MRVSILGLVTLLCALSLSGGAVAQSEPADIQRVILLDGTQQAQMKDMVASRKGSSNGVISKQFYAFKGARATLRTKTTLPEFEFETDATFDDPVYLFRFDVHGDRREIRVAKGTGGLTLMSLPKDHLIETRVEQIAKGSTKRYRLKPIAPLPPGEYCLSRRMAVCYDFGID